MVCLKWQSEEIFGILEILANTFNIVDIDEASDSVGDLFTLRDYVYTTESNFSQSACVLSFIPHPQTDRHAFNCSIFGSNHLAPFWVFRDRPKFAKTVSLRFFVSKWAKSFWTLSRPRCFMFSESSKRVLFQMTKLQVGLVCFFQRFLYEISSGIFCSKGPEGKGLVVFVCKASSIHT